MKAKNIEIGTPKNKQADSIREQNMEKFVACLEKAHACYEMNDYINCIKYAEICQNLNRDNPEIYYLKSLAFERLGKGVKAHLSCMQSMKYARKFWEEDDEGERWWVAAHEYGKQGQFNREIFCYDILIKINPKDYCAMHEKACVLRNMGKVEESLLYFDKAMEIGPEDEEYWLALTNKGTALAKIGRHEEAICLYDQSLVNPDNNWDRLGETWQAKGESLMKLCKYDEALQSFQQAQENGWHFIGLKSRGHALVALGRYEEAMECWDDIIKYQPLWSEVWMAKADVFRKLGKVQEARRCSRRARECKR